MLKLVQEQNRKAARKSDGVAKGIGILAEGSLQKAGAWMLRRFLESGWFFLRWKQGVLINANFPFQASDNRTEVVAGNAAAAGREISRVTENCGAWGTNGCRAMTPPN